MTNNLYLILLAVHILIIIVNYKLLKNPKPFPPEEIRRELRSGGVSLASSKYVGFSHYLLPRLAKSESNWVNGNYYWYKSCVKLGITGIVLTFFTMILGEAFNLFDPLIGMFIILIPSVFEMVFICFKMEKNILMD